MKRPDLAYRVNTLIEYDQNIVLEYSITINTVQFVCDCYFLCDRFTSIFSQKAVLEDQIWSQLLSFDGW